MLGDWEITLSGNVFTERDRLFFIDLMSLVHRRGFNSFVNALKVSNYGADPRHEQNSAAKVPDFGPEYAATKLSTQKQRVDAEDIPGKDFLLEQISKGIQEGLSS